MLTRVTLLMTLAAPYGVWASADHRLATYPGGRLITDSSAKHVGFRCTDGTALVSYTGLGRGVGHLDVSKWMRQILRGESRTLDETFVDLREQATARFGLQARRINMQHAFLVGAFRLGDPWILEIKNMTPQAGISLGGIQPGFVTAALSAEKPVLLVAGAGRDAILASDRELLVRIAQRRPRRPEDFMTVLGDVNRRAAESRHPMPQQLAAHALSHSWRRRANYSRSRLSWRANCPMRSSTDVSNVGMELVL
jgi:hypothetical protein